MTMKVLAFGCLGKRSGSNIPCRFHGTIEDCAEEDLCWYGHPIHPTLLERSCDFEGAVGDCQWLLTDHNRLKDQAANILDTALEIEGYVRRV
jgi:hypothetical protein